jgi:hypothetical protein
MIRKARDEGKIEEPLYFKAAWAAYRAVGIKHKIPELVQLGAYGQLQSERLVNQEITRTEYEYLIIEKRNELSRQATASQQASSTDYLGATLTVLQILSLLGPQSPLAGGPHQAAPTVDPPQQRQPTHCQYLGNGIGNCW